MKFYKNSNLHHVTFMGLVCLVVGMNSSRYSRGWGFYTNGNSTQNTNTIVANGVVMSKNGSLKTGSITINKERKVDSIDISEGDLIMLDCSATDTLSRPGSYSRNVQSVANPINIPNMVNSIVSYNSTLESGDINIDDDKIEISVPSSGNDSMNTSNVVNSFTNIGGDVECKSIRMEVYEESNGDNFKITSNVMIKMANRDSTLESEPSDESTSETVSEEYSGTDDSNISGDEVLDESSNSTNDPIIRKQQQTKKERLNYKTSKESGKSAKGPLTNTVSEAERRKANNREWYKRNNRIHLENNDF